MAALSPTLRAQSPFSHAFDEFVHLDGSVGGAYVVLERGQIIEFNSWGMADMSVKQPVDRNTVFHWASITKTLTAVSIMQLRDRGKLSLDDPILKYVPELARVHSEDNAIARVTIRHLLSHTAGFPGPTWPYREDKPWEPFEPSEWSQLVAMMPYQELAFAPGTKFQYSNPGFIYLARVIEAITGDPYQVYVQKNILTPLGMTQTFYNLSPYHLAADRSNSYEIDLDNQDQETVKAFGREFDTGITTPNGGLNAPLDDMAKWVGFLARSSPVSNQNRILDRKSLEEMWRPVAPITEEGYPIPLAMGLSFFLYPRGSAANAITFVGHTGHQAGFAAFFVLNPRNQRAIIAAFNTVHGRGDSPVARKRYEDSAQRFQTLMERAMDASR
ncbi:MAG TPA: serine hydrolase domain-containing protein [Terriglobales bacterium]|nr:serine hydrolase domain-containing protein [Terriglobales bacterium]